MKLIEVGYKANPYPLVLANKDSYDSLINVYDNWSFDFEIAKLKNILSVPFVNADATVKSKNIAVLPGDYFWIKGMHKPSKQYTLKNGKKSMGYPAIIYFNLAYLKDEKLIQQRFNQIKTYEDLTLEERTFPANQINPNWKLSILKAVNLHRGESGWDWSEGCHTIFDDERFYSHWDAFINTFVMNEKGRLTIYSK